MPVKPAVMDWVTSLPEGRVYELKEELRNGDIVTHGDSFTKPELLLYIANTWIDSVPPEYIICGR